MMRRLLLALAFQATFVAASAGELEYGLQPRQVAPDTYVLAGRNEDFDSHNGGNIANVGFIVTGAGVVVIDTGPSRRYGEQLRRAIASVTPKPVVKVLITHHHPDHFLGNQAFADVEIAALPATIEGIAQEGGGFTDNLYRLCGRWMEGTEPVTPVRSLQPGELEVGGHRLQLLALAGHTAGDLAVLDRTTGVLFAGDLAFLDRAPTTPHADLARWRASIESLSALAFTVLVPGHGEPATDPRALRQTRDWLAWVERTLREAAEGGLDMTEVLALPLPPQFSGMALAREEFARSVSHLYPALEAAALSRRPAP